MRSSVAAVISLLLYLLLASSANGQELPISEGVDPVGVHSEEGWAMRYVGASSLMTGFGAVPLLAPGQWQLAAELGHIPSLSRSQQQVGLGGIKDEDLNKSPAFGRARGWIGLPAGWVAELGYTPPLEIDGAKPVDLFAAAIGRRVELSQNAALSLRALGQHGAARGDITCSSDVVGRSGQSNPFRCVRRSDDRIRLRSQGQMPYFAAGAQQSNGNWHWGAELLYVPLKVRRDGNPIESDPFWSLRLSLRWLP